MREVSFERSGRERQIIDPQEWKRRFVDAWDARLKQNGLSVRVVVWKGA